MSIRQKFLFVFIFFLPYLFSQQQINEDTQSKIDNLIQQLQTSDIDERIIVIRELGKLGSVAEAAIPNLMQLIKSDDQNELKALVETLTAIGRVVIPTLTKFLSDENLQVRIVVLGTLGKIAEKEPVDISLFETFLYDKNPMLRMISSVILGRMGERGFSSLEKAITDPSIDIVISALTGLGQAGEKALPILTEKIQDDNQKICLAALQSLFLIAKQSKPAVVSLTTALKSKNFLVRQMAISYLKDVGDNVDAVIPEIIDASNDLILEVPARELLSNLGEKILPELIVALKSKDSRRQFAAQNILSDLKEKAIPILPVLLEMFQEKETRKFATRSLMMMKEHAASITPQLINLLTNKELRIDTIEILGSIGEKAGAAIPFILKIQQENAKDWTLEFAIRRTLVNMRDTAISHILQMFESEHEHVKSFAVSICKDLGPKALPALPYLIKALQDPKMVASAAEALGKIGTAASSAVPELMALLKTKSYVRSYAMEALEKMGETSEEFMIALIEIVKQKDRDKTPLKVLVNMPLEKIGDKVDTMIPVLLELMIEKSSFSYDDEKRTYARQILEKIGERCIPDLIARMKKEHLFSFAGILRNIESAVPLLIEAVKNKNNDLDIRIGAINALKSKEQAISTLIDVLNDQKENSRLRIFAAKTLETIGEKAKDAIPALLSAIHETDSVLKMADRNEGSLKSNALRALGEIQSKTEPYVDEFMAALKDDDLDVKQAAMVAIGNSEKPIPEAIPLIIEALNHEHWLVSYVAKEALIRINKRNPNPQITEVLEKKEKKDSGLYKKK